MHSFLKDAISDKTKAFHRPKRSAGHKIAE
jgi:hypothetical protein